MNTRPVLMMLMAGSLTYVIGGFSATSEMKSDDDPPIKLTSAVQGSCAKGELTSERGCVTPPRLGRRVSPEFPRAARASREGGSVTLGAIVEKDGTVGEVTVVESTNRGLGFEEAAVEAVKKWRFKPARIGGKPVRFYIMERVDISYH